MFGPDNCGDINRLHFIIDEYKSVSAATSHLNPRGTLYQLTIAGTKFRISANGRAVFSGDLTNDLNLSNRPFTRPLTGVAFDLWTVESGSPTSSSPTARRRSPSTTNAHPSNTGESTSRIISHKMRSEREVGSMQQRLPSWSHRYVPNCDRLAAQIDFLTV
jgi:hypothetical protein